MKRGKPPAPPIRETTDDGYAAIRPTPERHRHDEIECPEADRGNPIARPARVETQSTLDRYKRRKTLTEEQLAAAYKWHRLAVRSKRFPRCAMSWSGPVNGADHTMQDDQVAAGIQRDAGISYMASLNADFVSVLDHVCVDDYAAEGLAIRRKIHHRHGIATLRTALDRLCKYYGITR